MIITKIQRIRGRTPRYSIHLDGTPSLEISDWTIGKFGIRTGDEIDDATIDKIKSTEAETQAKNIAINFISYRPRSSKEVAVHLIKKGFAHGIADKVVNHLLELKLIDDTKFAEIFIRDRIKRKLIGAGLLRQQLAVKGISNKIIDRVIDDYISPKEQQNTAVQLAKKKMLSLKHSAKTNEDKRNKRIVDFLIRRGFSYETALKAVQSVLNKQ